MSRFVFNFNGQVAYPGEVLEIQRPPGTNIHRQIILRTDDVFNEFAYDSMRIISIQFRYKYSENT